MSTTALTPLDREELHAEVVEICQQLIRIPSVNYGEGIGDEAAIAQKVVKLLEEVGIHASIYESAPGRCNVVAKITGQDSHRPGLVVHGHLDVVPVNADDWSVDPFTAEIKDGMIWGRGAIDMKNMVAMIIAVFRLWARKGITPPRNIVLAFFADEEAGSLLGLVGWSPITQKYSITVRRPFLKWAVFLLHFQITSVCTSLKRLKKEFIGCV